MHSALPLLATERLVHLRERPCGSKVELVQFNASTAPSLACYPPPRPRWRCTMALSSPLPPPLPHETFHDRQSVQRTESPARRPSRCDGYCPHLSGSRPRPAAAGE